MSSQFQSEMVPETVIGAANISISNEILETYRRQNRIVIRQQQQIHALQSEISAQNSFIETFEDQTKGYELQIQALTDELTEVKDESSKVRPNISCSIH